MVHIHKLPGGLRILVEELPHTHSVSIGCFINVGSGHEQHELAGVSHFIEHMLFKGSQAYPTPKLISDAIEGVGGILDAYTSFESTVYYAKVAHIHFERALALLADIIQHPRFVQRDIEKERRVITEELHETADTPSDWVHTLLDAAMWGDQPLGRDIAGDEASVANLNPQAILDYWRQHYTQSSIVISLAGNIAADYATERVRQAFGNLPHGQAYAALESQPPQSGPALILQCDDSEQANFCLGFPGVAQNDPDRRALLVLDTVLGGGMSSRLVQEIREERGLAYSIGSFSREHHDSGKWVVFGSVEPSKLEECLHTILHELWRLKSEGITEAELAQVKEQVKGGILLSLEDSWSVAARNGSHMLRYGRVIPVEQVVAEVEAIQSEDVLRVARRMLRLEAMHLAVIGPYAEQHRQVFEQLLTI